MGEVRLIETPSLRLSQILAYWIVSDTGYFDGVSRVNNFDMPTIFFQHESKLPTLNDLSNCNDSFPTALIHSYIMSIFQINESLSNSIPIYPTSSRFFQLHCFQFHVELDTTGSDICNCDAGFRGYGEKCSDIDECALGIDNCSEDGTCTNTDGECTSECNAGLINDGLTCDDVNECD